MEHGLGTNFPTWPTRVKSTVMVGCDGGWEYLACPKNIQVAKLHSPTADTRSHKGTAPPPSQTPSAGQSSSTPRSSPPISDDEPDDPPPSQLPPATIRHHHTIMANRSNALGMHVSGRRVFTPRRALQMNEPRVNPIPTPDADRPSPPDPPPIPNFKGVVEMEARRKLRMLARGHASANPKNASDASKYLNPELSSSDDPDASLDDDGFDLLDRADDMDEGDEFDPYALFIPPPPHP